MSCPGQEPMGILSTRRTRQRFFIHGDSMKRIREREGRALDPRPRMWPPTTYGRRAILGGMTALPVIALAGCGGDDDTAPKSMETEPAGETRAPSASATPAASVATQATGSSPSPAGSDLRRRSLGYRQRCEASKGRRSWSRAEAPGQAFFRVTARGSNFQHCHQTPLGQA